MSFLLAYGAEKLASSIAVQKRRHQQKQLQLQAANHHSRSTTTNTTNKDGMPGSPTGTNSSSSSSSSLTSSSSSSCLPVADQWEDILHQLKHNQLVELRLGWQDSAYCPGLRALSTSLRKALRQNTSLRRICIGWNHWQKRHDVLLHLLTVLAESIRTHQLQSIHLVLTNDCIPASVLTKLLHSQVSLSSLTLQTISVYNDDDHDNKQGKDYHHVEQRDSRNGIRSTTDWTSGGDLTTNTASSLSSLVDTCNNHNTVYNLPRRVTKDRHGLFKLLMPNSTTVVPVVVNALLQPHSPVSYSSSQAHHHPYVLSELRLVDCDLKDHDIQHLAKSLLPTSVISIRGNRCVTGQGVATLIQAQRVVSLDCSLCNLHAGDFQLVAQALLSSSGHSPRKTATSSSNGLQLQELILRGNYRMELTGLQALLEVAPYVIESLDLSYCDWSEDMTLYLFQTLRDMGHQALVHKAAAPLSPSNKYHPTTTTMALRHLQVQGCRMRATRATEYLVQILQQNQPPLQSLAVHDDRNDRKYLSPTQLQAIAHAMQTNYELQDLHVDYFKNRTEQQLWKEIQFWQVLNRAGRRILVSSTSSSSSSSNPTITTSLEKQYREDWQAWIHLLQVAHSQPGLDSLYWVVQHSAERFRTLS